MGFLHREVGGSSPTELFCDLFEHAESVLNGSAYGWSIEQALGCRKLCFITLTIVYRTIYGGVNKFR